MRRNRDYQEKEQEMPSSTPRGPDLEGRKRVLQQQIDRAADELALLEKFGDQDYPNGTVIRWKEAQDRLLAPDDSGELKVEETPYQAAMKRNGYWYIFGNRTPGCRFEKVIKEILDNADRSTIEVSDTWKHVDS